MHRVFLGVLAAAALAPAAASAGGYGPETARYLRSVRSYGYPLVALQRDLYAGTGDFAPRVVAFRADPMPRGRAVLYRHTADGSWERHEANRPWQERWPDDKPLPGRRAGR